MYVSFYKSVLFMLTMQSTCLAQVAIPSTSLVMLILGCEKVGLGDLVRGVGHEREAEKRKRLEAIS